MDLDQLFTNTEYRTTTLTIPCYKKELVRESGNDNIPNNTSTNIANDDKSDNDNVEGKHNSQTSVVSLTIKASPAACTDYDLTGQIIWPVSMLLAHYLASQYGQGRLSFTQNHKTICDDLNVVELGAGTGVPSLIMASLFPQANLCLTDGNELVLDLLQQNIDLFKNDNNNSHSKSTSSRMITTQHLVWGTRKHVQSVLNVMPDKHVHVVLAADVVQWPAVVEPLLHTVKALLWKTANSTKSDRNTGSSTIQEQQQQQQRGIFILGIVNRANETYTLFFEIAKQLGFTWQKIVMSDFLPNDGKVPKECQEFGGRETEIYEMTLAIRSISEGQSQLPLLLQSDDDVDHVIGSNYEHTTSLPC